MPGDIVRAHQAQPIIIGVRPCTVGEARDGEHPAVRACFGHEGGQVALRFFTQSGLVEIEMDSERPGPDRRNRRWQRSGGGLRLRGRIDHVATRRVAPGDAFQPHPPIPAQLQAADPIFRPLPGVEVQNIVPPPRAQQALMKMRDAQQGIDLPLRHAGRQQAWRLRRQEDALAPCRAARVGKFRQGRNFRQELGLRRMAGPWMQGQRQQGDPPPIRKQCPCPHWRLPDCGCYRLRKPG